MRSKVTAALIVLGLTELFAAGRAHAFCRTTSVEAPAGYDPSVDGCVTQGLPLWWHSACVGYDIQQNASVRIPYADAQAAMATAFAQWTGVSCAAASASATSGPVSIGVRDLGGVDCDLVQYNCYHPNQNAIIFHDDVWPHNDSANALALTTVTFDVDTGEIFDADMEINSTLPLVYSPDVSGVSATGYDLLSVVTHEAGHFLGMAHSQDTTATMYAFYQPGETTKRALKADDELGICSIYAPGGDRSVVSNGAAATQVETACDPTPRHGFSSECQPARDPDAGCEAQPPSMASSCSIGPLGRGAGGGAGGALAVAGGVALMVAGRRRRVGRRGAAVVRNEPA